MTTDVLVLGGSTVEASQWRINTFEIVRQVSNQSE